MEHLRRMRVERASSSRRPTTSRPSHPRSPILAAVNDEYTPISMVIYAWFARVFLVRGVRVPQSLSFLREGSADNSSVPPSPSSSQCPSPLFIPILDPLVPASLPQASSFNSIEIHLSTSLKNLTRTAPLAATTTTTTPPASDSQPYTSYMHFWVAVPARPSALLPTSLLLLIRGVLPEPGTLS